MLAVQYGQGIRIRQYPMHEQQGAIVPEHSCACSLGYPGLGVEANASFGIEFS